MEEVPSPPPAAAAPTGSGAEDVVHLTGKVAEEQIDVKSDGQSGEVVQQKPVEKDEDDEDDSIVVATVADEKLEKPDLNKSGVEEHDEIEEDEDVVVLPSRQSSPVMTAPAAAKVKDDLLLTLGGSWGPKKVVFEEKLPVRSASAAAAAAAAGDMSLSLGSSGKGGGAAAPSVSVRSVSNTTTLSRSFVHNPSCSLTHNSFEDLNSSATQYFAGHENETVSHGGVFAHLAAANASDPQGVHRYRNAPPPFESSAHNNFIAAAAGAKNLNNNNKEFPGKWNSYNLEKYHALFPDLKEGFRAKYAGSRRSKHKGDEHGRVLPGESRVGLYEIAADPIAVVAHKLQELPDIFLEDLKRSLTEMLESVEKRDEFLRLQRILQRRNDLTAENLYVAHRTQLELLVAMKTGIQAFLLRENPLPTSALVEIFLQKRCRNIACQNTLPVDECDCQFCSQKEGFCSACMCIACCKFDFMANTCRWVGCDYCLHWCHTDCGIRLSYIKPGTAQGGGKAGQVEMQFQCVACNHTSDLFGFVREVFMTFSKDWSPEALRQELDCIHRIFRRSQDFRGKQLCWIAERLLSKVEGCSDTSDICETLVRFFQEGKVDLDKANANNIKVAQGGRASEVVYNHVVPGDMMKKPPSNRGNNLQMLDREIDAKRDEMAEMQYNRARKRSEVEEMESLIHIKQAEAKMFELRADEARLESERLRKIVVAKSEKIEEDYVAKGYKLHVNEAMEKRKRCFVEYQMLEQGLQDFNSMKAKLVTDVHEVLRKMDVMKRNRML